MTKQKDKYEVVEYKAGGFFIHGGSLDETYFKRKEDAQVCCDALNQVERLKLRRNKDRIDLALRALQELNEGLQKENISGIYF